MSLTLIFGILYVFLCYEINVFTFQLITEGKGLSEAGFEECVGVSNNFCYLSLNLFLLSAFFQALLKFFLNAPRTFL